MLGQCLFCDKQVTDKVDAYKEILALVKSKGSKGATLAEATGRWAHGECVRSLKLGVDPNQRALL